MFLISGLRPTSGAYISIFRFNLAGNKRLIELRFDSGSVRVLTQKSHPTIMVKDFTAAFLCNLETNRVESRSAVAYAAWRLVFVYLCGKHQQPAVILQAAVF